MAALGRRPRSLTSGKPWSATSTIFGSHPRVLFLLRGTSGPSRPPSPAARYAVFTGLAALGVGFKAQAVLRR